MSNLTYPKYELKTKQSGSSLIEVLVAVIIMSIGLLGLAAMQTTAMKNNYSALQRTQASLLAYEFIDLMRVNENPAIFQTFDSSSTYNSNNDCLTTTGCSTAQMAENDLSLWKTSLFQQLGATATSAITGTPPNFTLTINWIDDRSKDTVANQTKSFSTSFRL